MFHVVKESHSLLLSEKIYLALLHSQGPLLDLTISGVHINNLFCFGLVGVQREFFVWCSVELSDHFLSMSKLVSSAYSGHWDLQAFSEFISPVLVCKWASSGHSL